MEEMKKQRYCCYFLYFKFLTEIIFPINHCNQVQMTRKRLFENTKVNLDESPIEGNNL